MQILLKHRHRQARQNYTKTS